MARYVDGFVICVPKNRIEDYRAMSQKASAIFKEHGALEYSECVGDDLDVPNMFTFLQLAQPKEDETVVFAWVVYESREARDQANAKVMVDERMSQICDPSQPIFDMKRMAYGGFEQIVRA